VSIKSAVKMDPFRAEAVEAIHRATELPPAEVDAALTRPPKVEMGDFAFPCFVLAKKLKKAPPAIAQELAEGLTGELKLLGKAIAAGPYVNLFVDRHRFAEKTLRAAVEAGADFGNSTEGAGKVVCIDYSSPNIAKPFHVGHLRSTILGGALYRIYRKLGYETVGINHLGDWGTQFGKLTVAIKRWAKPGDIEDLMALNRLYVKYHEEEKEHPELADEAREWFRKQEAGDSEALELWHTIREGSLAYFKKIYARLDAQFDSFDGEAFFNDKMDAVIEEAKAKKLLTVSDGAEVIDLEPLGMDVPALLRKADGATLYLTRDLAAVQYRKATYGFQKLLYVVGTEQALHFKQLFGALKLLGHDYADTCTHVNFGRVQGMSSRKGNVIYLEELLDEAKTRALANMRKNVEKRQEVEDEEAVAEAVGIAAIFFSDLSKQRIKDYAFDWDRAISFEGDTGPYLMNAHARIAGIVRHSGVEVNPEADLTPLVEPEAHEMISLVSRYPDALREAARLDEPSVISQYLLDLAHALHSSYHSLRVKGEETKPAEARLLLFSVVKNVLASGLRILGITPLERM